MIERADRLSAPPVVGRYYLVPIVTAEWHGVVSSWPVVGPPHTDVEFFNFKVEHYHIDGRFLSVRQFKMIEDLAPWRTPAAELQAAPLHGLNSKELPKPEIVRRRCISSHIDYQHGHQQPIQDIRQHFSGVQCERGKGGWICPHRKASLGSVAAIDGIITCPLHGLQIDAATGKTLFAAQSGGAA